MGGLGLGFGSFLLPLSAPAAERKREEVIFWHQWTSNWAEVVHTIVRRFNESQDRYEVRPLIVAGGVANTKMMLGIVGGSPPDCMAQWSPVIAAWARRGMLTPLDSLMAEGEYERIQQWLYPAVREMGSYEGHLYGLATGMNAWALYYNPRHFREAGLDPNRPPRTIAELDSAAEKLFRFRSDHSIERLGFLPGNLLHWSAVFGGRWLDPVTHRPQATHPQTIAALAWMQSYGKKYDINRIVQFQSGLASQFEADWPFLTGKISMVEDGQWRVTQIAQYAPKDFEYRVCPLPSPDGNKLACWSNGNFMIIPRGAKNPRGAWEFMKFWTGWTGGDDPDLQRAGARSAEFYVWGGWLPAGRTIPTQPAYQEYMARYPAFRTFVDLIQSPDVQVTPQVPVQQFFLDRLGANVEAVMRGRKSPEAALQTVERETQEELRRVLAR